MRAHLASITSCVLIPALGIAVYLDNWVAASRSVAFVVWFTGLGIAVGMFAVAIGRRRVYLLPALLFVLFIVMLPFVDLGPVKPALRAIHEIKPGMTEREVRAIVERQFPENGRFARPRMGPVYQGVLGFALDPADGRYNAAIVQVTFVDGRCVSSAFLAD